MAVTKARAITRRLEEEAQKAGYNMETYLAAKAANSKLVPASKATTREKAVREYAAQKRLLAKWLVDLRTKQKTECEAAEQQVDEGVDDIVQKTNDAMEHGAEVDEHMEKAAAPSSGARPRACGWPSCSQQTEQCAACKQGQRYRGES